MNKHMWNVRYTYSDDNNEIFSNYLFRGRALYDTNI